MYLFVLPALIPKSYGRVRLLYVPVMVIRTVWLGEHEQYLGTRATHFSRELVGLALALEGYRDTHMVALL